MLTAIKNALTRTAVKGDSPAPDFFARRQALTARIAGVEAQIAKLATDADALLGDLNAGDSLVEDLGSIENKTRSLKTILEADKHRLAELDKTGFERATEVLRSRLAALRREVITALEKAVKLRVAPWVVSGLGDAADIENQQLDLDLICAKSHILQFERGRQGGYHWSFDDVKQKPADWLPGLPFLLAEITATEGRLKLAQTFADDADAPYDQAEFDRFDTSAKATKKLDVTFEPPPSRDSIIFKHCEKLLQLRLRAKAAAAEMRVRFVIDEGHEESMRHELNTQLNARHGYEPATSAEILDRMTKLKAHVHPKMAQVIEMGG